MTERDWINQLVDILDCTRSQASQLADKARAEGYQPFAIPGKTTVDISGAIPDNQPQRDS